MGKPYSLDLRKRVVAAVSGGLSCNQAAKRFGVAVSTAIGWVRRQRESGSVAAGKMGGHRPKAISGEHRVWVLERVKRDFALRGLVAEFAERGLKVDYRSVWEFVHAEKLSFKKSVVAGERDRPDVARRRAQWVKYQDRVEPERLVFIDETWTRTDMAALWGWAPRGQRLPAKVPHGRWKTMTFLAALRMTGSRPHGFSRGRSTATASASTWRRFFYPRFGPVTSWSWTTSAVIEAKRCVSSFAPLGPSSSSCQNTLQT
jgi:transposase